MLSPEPFDLSFDFQHSSTRKYANFSSNYNGFFFKYCSATSSSSNFVSIAEDEDKKDVESIFISQTLQDNDDATAAESFSCIKLTTDPDSVDDVSSDDRDSDSDESPGSNVEDSDVDAVD